MDASEDEQLSHQCLAAISGADTKRQQILSLIESDVCGIKGNIYAVKSRVKDPNSLHEKVLDRRDKGKNIYQATDARDIIGVRLLTLHYIDTSKLATKLVDFVRFGQREEVNLFTGTSLDEAIEEIIVYKSSEDSSVYDDIWASVRLLVRPQGDRENVKLAPSPANKAYSSIHMVCRCTGSDLVGRPFIPVEFQIRNSIEDTWAEVDHKLKYKGDGGVLGFGDDTTDLLHDIKGHADLLSRTIHRVVGSAHRAQQLEKVGNSQPIYVLNRHRLDPDHEVSDSFDDKTRQLAKKIGKNIEECRIIHNQGLGETEKAKNLYLSTIDLLDQVEVDRSDIKARRWVALEKASCSGEIAQLIGSPKTSKDRTLKAQHLAMAFSEYEAISDALPEDSWIFYRWGTTFMQAGMLADASDKVEKAIRLSENDPRVSSDCIRRAGITKTSAFLFWLRKQAIYNETIDLTGTHEVSALRQIDFLEKAGARNLQALNLLSDAILRARKANNIEDREAAVLQHNKVLLNAACYAWELKYIYSTSPQAALTADGRKKLKELVESYDETCFGSTAERLDSVMKAADVLDLKRDSIAYAKRIIDILSTEKENDKNSQFMLFCSRNVLNRRMETS